MKKFKILLLTSIIMLFTACGGGGGSSSNTMTPSVNPETPQTIALDKIITYADDNTQSAPTIQDYVDAGVVGVTVENIDDVNNVVANLTAEDVDTTEKIQKIVDDLGINILPTANAGSDKSIEVNQVVTITGIGTDIDGTIVSYEWKKDATVLATTASFDYLPTVVGTDTLMLTVMDDDGGTASDSMNVTATEAAPSPVSLTLMSVLNDNVRETSGLANVKGKIYTHNDSGGSNLLYEINASTGNVIRSITVNGASNVDWEDLACDDTYLYIADIGNNLGSRTDLKIYKILKSDLDAKIMVNAETISFSYADQSTFTYDPFTTPYDAEALIAYNGKLYIFTKNWENHISKAYSIPTVPGSYEVTSVDENILDVMITGAAIDGAGSSVALVGYTNPYDIDTPFKSMIVKLGDFTGNNFFSGSIAEYEIQNSQIIGQVEAILFNTPSEFYLSAESATVQSLELPAKLYKTEISE